MSVYDTIVIGDRAGQVKCFQNRMNTYSVGSYVGHVWVGDEELADYSVAMREGGFVNIIGGMVQGWTDEPECEVVIDKWGNLFDAEDESPDAGLLWKEKYFFSDMEEGDSNAGKGQS